MIYLDNHATTQTDARVVEAMLPYFSQHYGNPSSQSHKLGWNSKEACENARLQIAENLGAQSKEIIFNSGATESINFIVQTVVQRELQKKEQKRTKIISLHSEHKAVLETIQAQRRLGFEIVLLRPQKNGLLNFEELEQALDENTLLLSIMLVNNEIGVIQDIKKVAELCAKKGILLHSDMAQAIGRVSINLHKMGVDFASFAAHKFYGPPGIGATYVKQSKRKYLGPFLRGGGQERGFRPGTLNVPGIVGFSKACSLAVKNFKEEHLFILSLKNHFLEILNQNRVIYHIHGCQKQRVAGNLSIAFTGIEAERLLLRVQKDIACSAGSACTSVQLEPSHVLKAIGVSNAVAHQTLRFGFGRFQNIKDVEIAANLISRHIKKLLDSPGY